MGRTCSDQEFSGVATQDDARNYFASVCEHQAALDAAGPALMASDQGVVARLPSMRAAGAAALAALDALPAPVAALPAPPATLNARAVADSSEGAVALKTQDEAQAGAGAAAQGWAGTAELLQALDEGAAAAPPQLGNAQLRVCTGVKEKGVEEGGQEQPATGAEASELLAPPEMTTSPTCEAGVHAEAAAPADEQSVRDGSEAGDNNSDAAARDECVAPEDVLLACEAACGGPVGLYDLD
jgi:hypothetical protein